MNYCRHLAAVLDTSPREDGQKATALAKLYALLAVDSGLSDDLVDVRNIAYLEALSAYPGWAVAQAVRWWISGDHRAEGERRQFVPKPCDLIRLIKLALEPVKFEQRRAERMLESVDHATAELAAPPEPTPEERASIARRLQSLAASLRLRDMSAAQGVDLDSIPDAEQPASWLPEARAH